MILKSDALTRAVRIFDSSRFDIAAELIQSREEEISKVLSRIELKTFQPERYRAFQRIHELSLQPYRYLGAIDQMHRSWLIHINDTMSQTSQLDSFAKLVLSDVSQSLATTRIFWEGLDSSGNDQVFGH